MITFERTSIFCKEDGLKRMLPYEFVTFGGEPFFGFAPMSLDPLAEVTTSTTTIDLGDYFYDHDVIRQEFDKIVGDVLVDSEKAFLSLYEGTSGYYNANPSAEFGY